MKYIFTLIFVIWACGIIRKSFIALSAEAFLEYKQNKINKAKNLIENRPIYYIAYILALLINIGLVILALKGLNTLYN